MTTDGNQQMFVYRTTNSSNHAGELNTTLPTFPQLESLIPTPSRVSRKQAALADNHARISDSFVVSLCVLCASVVKIL